MRWFARRQRLPVDTGVGDNCCWAMVIRRRNVTNSHLGKPLAVCQKDLGDDHRPAAFRLVSRRAANAAIEVDSFLFVRIVPEGLGRGRINDLPLCQFTSTDPTHVGVVQTVVSVSAKIIPI
jgi:hypothetical protein